MSSTDQTVRLFIWDYPCIGLDANQVWWGNFRIKYWRELLHLPELVKEEDGKLCLLFYRKEIRDTNTKTRSREFYIFSFLNKGKVPYLWEDKDPFPLDIYSDLRNAFSGQRISLHAEIRESGKLVFRYECVVELDTNTGLLWTGERRDVVANVSTPL